MAQRWSMDLRETHHLSSKVAAVEHIGLHCAVNEIQSGGRVLWAHQRCQMQHDSLNFASLNIVESSRFHAMNLIGAMDRCVDAIVEAEHSLPESDSLSWMIGATLPDESRKNLLLLFSI